MNRNTMLKKLQSIKKTLVSLTAFSDGVTCEYMSSRGCGEFELLDWSDLDEHDYETPDQVWEDMCDDELEKWLNRLEKEEFSPIGSLK